ncbi:hypothetical protein EVAR_37462_1 [Eumeta japonica]|uniref:Uncharacterized protein n=1 Tax=Eumeta variegata TaxID=151549 RepID=A0A4C1XCN6_EUMVA|nr:hypothetical protein EVAR_37462_1 [Eumeta japonica]
MQISTFFRRPPVPRPSPAPRRATIMTKRENDIVSFLPAPADRRRGPIMRAKEDYGVHENYAALRKQICFFWAHHVYRSSGDDSLVMKTTACDSGHAHPQENADSHIDQGVRSDKKDQEMRSQPPYITCSHALANRSKGDKSLSISSHRPSPCLSIVTD